MFYNQMDISFCWNELEDSAGDKSWLEVAAIGSRSKFAHKLKVLLTSQTRANHRRAGWFRLQFRLASRILDDLSFEVRNCSLISRRFLPTPRKSLVDLFGLSISSVWFICWQSVGRFSWLLEGEWCWSRDELDGLGSLVWFIVLANLYWAFGDLWLSDICIVSVFELI